MNRQQPQGLLRGGLGPESLPQNRLMIPAGTRLAVVRQCMWIVGIPASDGEFQQPFVPSPASCLRAPRGRVGKLPDPPPRRSLAGVFGTRGPSPDHHMADRERYDTQILLALASMSVSKWMTEVGLATLGRVCETAETPRRQSLVGEEAIRQALSPPREREGRLHACRRPSMPGIPRMRSPSARTGGHAIVWEGNPS